MVALGLLLFGCRRAPAPKTGDRGGADLAAAGSTGTDSSAPGDMSAPGDLSAPGGDTTDGFSAAVDLAPTPDLSRVFDTPYFPLASGLAWRYRQTKFDGTIGTVCYNDGSTLTYTMGAVKQDGGTPSYPQQFQPNCLLFSEVDYGLVGNAIMELAAGGPYVVYDFPPTLGKTWAAGGASGASSSWDMHYDTYTVAAGTFKDCWRAKQDGYENWQIMCSGVGMIVSAEAAFGYDLKWELTSKNF
jgi:hypothetical protein